MNKMYIAGYERGCWDDHEVVYIFVTDNEEVAKAWVERFQRILDTQEQLPNFEYDNWEKHMSGINSAFYKEIEKR